MMRATAAEADLWGNRTETSVVDSPQNHLPSDDGCCAANDRAENLCAVLWSVSRKVIPAQEVHSGDQTSLLHSWMV